MTLSNRRKKKGNLPGRWLGEIMRICVEEYRHMFRDVGVIVIFFAASLLYPLIYNGIYYNEVLRDVDVAVVDLAHTPASRQFGRQLDATPELRVSYPCLSMEEAQQLFRQQRIHGILCIPENFSQCLSRQEQTTVSMYSDMSSFMYYRAMMAGASAVVQQVNKDIRLERLYNEGITGRAAEVVADPLPFTSTILYNSYAGFASFLLPAILILILHQTLVLGITMEAGTRKEENKFHLLIPAGSRRSMMQIVTGKSLTYFFLYLIFSVYILGLIPRFFNLPHIGQFVDVIWFSVPFLLATIFFSMTISVFITRRETGLVIYIFSSLILLFLSGVSWPQSSISGFWRVVACLFPSTFGIQAYVKLNTMGADLSAIRMEYIGLWVQTAVYFITTLSVYRWQVWGGTRLLKRHRHHRDQQISVQS